VVRLNSKRTYDAKRTFVEVANIQHTDMVFTDGTPPTDTILNNFLNLCEEYIEDVSVVDRTNSEITEPNAIDMNVNSDIGSVINCIGAVAVHCKGMSNSRLNYVSCLPYIIIIFSWSGKNGLLSGFVYRETLVVYRRRSHSVDSYMSSWVSDWRTTTMAYRVTKYFILYKRYCVHREYYKIKRHVCLSSKEGHLKTVGKQWREKRKYAVNKYIRFKNGVYSVKRHNSNVNTCELVDSPPESCISKEEQSSSGSDISGATEHVKLETVSYIRFNRNSRR